MQRNVEVVGVDSAFLVSNDFISFGLEVRSAVESVGYESWIQLPMTCCIDEVWLSELVICDSLIS